MIHYIWLVKADKHKPLQYAFVLGVLLLYRVGTWALEMRKKTAPPSARRRPVEATEA